MKHVEFDKENILEHERTVLYELVTIYGLQHPAVIRQSEILDDLINRYNREAYD